MSAFSAAGIRWAVLAMALATWLAFSSAATAAPPLSLSEYQSALDAARTAAISTPRSASLQQAGTLRRRIAALIPGQVEVRMPSGAIVSVDNRPLLRAQSSASASQARLQVLVAVNRLLASTAPPAPSLDRAKIDRTLRGVLRRPEYQIKDRGVTWIDRFVAWLARVLDRWLPRPARQAVGGGDRLARIMVVVVVLLLAALVARVLFLVWPDLRRRRTRPESEGPKGELLIPQEPDELWAAAEREAAAGRYREALLLAYRAVVARLERAAVLPEDRSRTGWELLRDLRRRERDALKVTSDEAGKGLPVPPLAPQELSPSLVTRYSSLVTLLTPLIGQLDERLYGGRTATAVDVEVCRTAYQEMERLLCLPA